MRRWAHNGALNQLFVALREMNLTDAGVECLNIDMADVKTHLDGTGAEKKPDANHRQMEREDPADRIATNLRLLDGLGCDVPVGRFPMEC